MATYETDDEKVEAIKKWLKDNGISVVLGVTIGLGAVLGWRQWSNYRDDVRQEASAAFEQLMAGVQAESTDSVREQSALIAEEFPSTPYAALAALVRARFELEAGDAEASRTALEQAIAQAGDPSIARVAALRLARVLISQGDLDAASAVIEAHDDGGAFGADFNALRADIAAVQGRDAEAADLYQLAIQAGAANERLLQLKLDNLAPAG